MSFLRNPLTIRWSPRAEAAFSIKKLAFLFSFVVAYVIGLVV